MALRAVIDHPKFSRLKAMLCLNKCETLGYLEGLWHFTGRFTPQGNIGKYSDDEIEAWLEWRGQPGALVSGLLACRWLDANDEHRLIVHDWHKHADDATRRSLQRAKLDFAVKCPDGVGTESGQGRDAFKKSPQPSGPPEGQGQESGAESEETSGQDAHDAAQKPKRTQRARKPAAPPDPPATGQEQAPSVDSAQSPQTPLVQRFEAFWTAYPHKKNKLRAWEAFLKVRPDEALFARMLAALEKAKHSKQWTKDGGEFIPHPASWLRAGGWLDEDDPADVAPPVPVAVLDSPQSIPAVPTAAAEKAERWGDVLDTLCQSRYPVGALGALRTPEFAERPYVRCLGLSRSGCWLSCIHEPQAKAVAAYKAQIAQAVAETFALAAPPAVYLLIEPETDNPAPATATEHEASHEVAHA